MDCKYHSDKNALWHCEQCDIPFCMDCVEVESGTIAPKCLLCRNYLSSYGMSEEVEPFWNKLNSFYRYPLQKPAQSFLLFYAIASLVIGFLISVIPFAMINFVLKMTLFSVLVGYVFSVMSKTAKGDFDAPNYDQTVTYNTDGMTIKVIGLFAVLLVLGIATTQMFSLNGFYIYILLVIFVLPAVLVTLGMSRHLSSALSPIEMIRTIAGIGFPYLIVVGLTAIIFFSLSWATGFIQYWLPDPVVYLVSQTAAAFFFIMMFHLLGYVAFQYHAELGYGVDVEVLASKVNIQMTPELRAMAHADVYIQEGRYQDGMNELLKAGQNTHYKEMAYSKLIKLNAAKNDTAGVIKAAALYFDNPDLDKNAYKAMQTYHQVRKIEHRFRPMNANARAVLLGQIRSKSQAEDAEYLMQDLEEKFSNDHDLPKALLAKAKYFIDIEHNDIKGLETLNLLIKSYPNGDHRVEVLALIKACEALV